MSVADRPGWLVAAVATAVPMPSGAHGRAQRRHPRHRPRPAPARELDVGALGTDRDQVSRLGRLWFDALAGICAHVRKWRGRADPVGHRPGAAKPTPDSTSFSRQYEIADVLPLTPLQQGLLFHASTARGGETMCTRCSWPIT